MRGSEVRILSTAPFTCQRRRPEPILPVMKKPELLSPAGSLKSMRYAFAYGADAVYAGQPRYSLRARNNTFKKGNLEIGIEEAHGCGKKFYVAANLFPHNPK